MFEATTDSTTTSTTVVVSGSTVWLGGEHDASTARAVRAALGRADHAGFAEASDVVVDLSGVEFMASATVRVLAEAGVELAGRDRSLTVRSPSGPARRVLGLCDAPFAWSDPQPDSQPHPEP